MIAIDLHRGHLDPAVATMPLEAATAARVVAANAEFLRWCRAASIPVFHCVATYRDAEEIRANPGWRARAEDPDDLRNTVLVHNLKGSPGCTIMPDLFDASDFVIDAKKRYDCFLGTDLDLSLRAHGADTVLITGVNTNSCVLATSATACRAKSKAGSPPNSKTPPRRTARRRFFGKSKIDQRPGRSSRPATPAATLRPVCAWSSGLISCSCSWSR